MNLQKIQIVKYPDYSIFFIVTVSYDTKFRNLSWATRIRNHTLIISENPNNNGINSSGFVFDLVSPMEIEDSWLNDISFSWMKKFNPGK